MKKSGGIPSKYSESFRIKVAKDYLSSNLSLAEIAQKYEFVKREQVRWIVKWYREKYGLPKPKSIKSPADNERGDVIELKEQIKLKDLALSNAFLQIDNLKTLIQVAEKSLNISIGKKYGAK